MAKIPLCKAQQSYPFTDFLLNAGVPVSTYLEKFRLPAQLLEEKNLFVDESRLWCWVEYVNGKEGVSDLGLLVGQDMSLMQLGSFGWLVSQQPTLLRALETCCRIISTESVVCRMGLERRHGYCWLTMTHLPGAPPIHKSVVLYDIQFMLKIVQSATSDSWLPPAVELSISTLPSGIHPEQLSTGPVYLSKPAPALAIPENLLALPMGNFAPHKPDLPGYSEEDQFANIPTTGFTNSLKWLIKGYLDERLTVYDVAELIGMGRRTLQRKLSEAGASYQIILDQARFEVAREMLSGEAEIPVTEVAFRLGYGDTSNFSRAFKRWSGVSPSQFRMSLFSSGH